MKNNIVNFALLYPVLFFQSLSGHQAIAEEPKGKTQITSDIPDRVLANPENGIKVLKLTHKLINTYRSRHAGSYPSSLFDVYLDVPKDKQAYGFDDENKVQLSLINPDNQYSDDQSIRNFASRLVSVIYTGRRHDNTLLGSAKLTGLRDVIGVSSLYARDQKFLDAQETYTRRLSGFHLVLWDDGQISQIPYDQTLYMYEDDGFVRVFPGQAGITYNCVSYEEFFTNVVPYDMPPICYPLSEDHTRLLKDNGGYESVIALGRLLNFPINREQVWEKLGKDNREFSLDDVQKGLAKLGFVLKLKKVSLDELQNLNTPSIFLTKDSKRVVTIASFDGKEGITIDQGMTHIVSRDILQKIFGDEALFSEAATTLSKETPSLLVDDSVRIFEVGDRAADIKQNVRITNSGKSPLTLQFERPILGCKDADLSTEIVAPGQSSILSLTLKWRDVLKGDTQNVFVFLRTNDPRCPRLQLGFKLISRQVSMPKL